MYGLVIDFWFITWARECNSHSLVSHRIVYLFLSTLFLQRSNRNAMHSRTVWPISPIRALSQKNRDQVKKAIKFQIIYLVVIISSVSSTFLFLEYFPNTSQSWKSHHTRHRYRDPLPFCIGSNWGCAKCPAFRHSNATVFPLASVSLAFVDCPKRIDELVKLNRWQHSNRYSFNLIAQAVFLASTWTHNAAQSNLLNDALSPTSSATHSYGARMHITITN